MPLQGTKNDDPVTQGGASLCPGLAYVESFQDSFALEPFGVCLGSLCAGRRQVIQISVNLLSNSGDAPLFDLSQ